MWLCYKAGWGGGGGGGGGGGERGEEGGEGIACTVKPEWSRSVRCDAGRRKGEEGEGVM